MEPNLQADGIFRAIVDAPDPAARIRDMIGRVPESVYLDYKQNGSDGSNKENWAKALSGFGNTAGGVLVWGLKCDGLLPTELAPIPKAEALRARLNQLVPCLTEEPVSGVEVRSFPFAPGLDEGFVVCFVPLSRRRPHRVVNGKEFYFRVTDNFIPLPVPSLRTLFYPHTFSRLSIYYQLRSARPGSIHLDAQMQNEGPASARDLACQYLTTQTEKSVIFSNHWIENTRAVQNTRLFRIKPELSPLHPSQFVTLFSIELSGLSLRELCNAQFRFRFKCFLLDQQPTEFEVDLSTAIPELDTNYLATVLQDAE